jgi:hypothetical protein
MGDENLLSWNIPNFVTIVLMIALLWCALGFLGHIFIRRPKATSSAATASASVTATETQVTGVSPVTGNA